MSDDDAAASPTSRPLDRAKEQKAWYWYDWANSAYVTTIAAVLFAPYLTSVAEAAPAARRQDDFECDAPLSILGLDISAGSLVVLPRHRCDHPLRADPADRRRGGRPSPRKKTTLMARFAWTGAALAMLMFFVPATTGSSAPCSWSAPTLCLGAQPGRLRRDPLRDPEPDERDRVSSRGWALGYLGGGILLAANFVLLTLMSDITEGWRCGLRCLSAGIWWAAFTIIPLPRRQEPRAQERRPGVRGSSSAQSFGQLWTTLKDLRGYPITLTFLLAYLFYNDGIQTVIYAASVYGEKELDFEKSTVLSRILDRAVRRHRRRPAVRPDRAAPGTRKHASWSG